MLTVFKLDAKSPYVTSWEWDLSHYCLKASQSWDQGQRGLCADLWDASSSDKTAAFYALTTRTGCVFFNCSLLHFKNLAKPLCWKSCSLKMMLHLRGDVRRLKFGCKEFKLMMFMSRWNRPSCYGSVDLQRCLWKKKKKLSTPLLLQKGIRRERSSQVLQIKCP